MFPSSAEKKRIERTWQKRPCRSNKKLQGEQASETQNFFYIYIVYSNIYVTSCSTAHSRHVQPPRDLKRPHFATSRATLRRTGSAFSQSPCWRVPSRNPLTKRSLKFFKASPSPAPVCPPPESRRRPSRASYGRLATGTRTFGVQEKVKLNGTVVIARSTQRVST